MTISDAIRKRDDCGSQLPAAKTRATSEIILHYRYAHNNTTGVQVQLKLERHHVQFVHCFSGSTQLFVLHEQSMHGLELLVRGVSRSQGRASVKHDATAVSKIFSFSLLAVGHNKLEASGELRRSSFAVPFCPILSII